MSENQSDETLDARGRRCSMLSTVVAQKIGRLSLGAVLKVLTDDPGAPSEMPAWCRSTGHVLLGYEPTGTGFRLRIRRAG